mmetsp:Transcript_6137/g.7439  ORF Transcript_6137/g.7439 Transcript_6137/m.7439 type:complete len:342 (+) Transcript_6137:150-1175(+)
MAATCETHWPSKSCGMGSCVNSTCFCFEGWEQTNELNLFIADDSAARLCNFNSAIYQAIFIALLFCACVILTVRTTVSCLDTKRKLKRGISNTFACMCMACLSLLRLLNPDALFGEDIAFTVLFSNAFAFFAVASLQSQNGYLKYLTKSYPMKQDKRWLAIYTISATKYFQIAGVVLLQLWWLSIFADKSVAKLIIIRFAIAVHFCIYLHFSLILYVTSQAIQDMEFLLLHQDLPDVIKVSSEKVERVYAQLRRDLPTAKKLNLFGLSYCCLSALSAFLPLVWNFWMRNWMYLLFLTFPLYSLLSSCDLYRKYRKRYGLTTTRGNSLDSSLSVEADIQGSL